MATEKQKKAFKKIVEKRGKIGKAMVNAGYSPNTAKNPKNLTESKGFRELAEKYLPDKNLLRIHKKLLNASTIDHYVFPGKESDKSIKRIFEAIGLKVLKITKRGPWKRAYYLVPDNPTIRGALDMAYKAKGKYAPQRVQFEDPYADMTDDELDEKIEELEAKVKRGRPQSKRKTNKAKVN